jgi:hypothetical protein
MRYLVLANGRAGPSFQVGVLKEDDAATLLFDAFTHT